MASFSIDARIDDFFHLLSFQRPLSHPAHYHVLAESPFRADSKGWNLTLLDHLVKRRRVNLEQVAFRGFPDQAMRRSCEALRMARDSRSSPLLSVVLIFAADFFIRYGEEDRLRESIETLAAVAAELEPTPAVPPLIEIRKGWLLAESGELQKGIETIRNGIARLLATGCIYHYSFHRALLALAYLRDNQVDNAFGSLDDALRFVEQTGERFNEAELHRLRGELLLARGRASDEEEMQGCFRKAIEIARVGREILGTARDDEPRTAARDAGSSRRSARDARRDLRLVHRGLRHRRPER